MSSGAELSLQGGRKVVLRVEDLLIVDSGGSRAERECRVCSGGVSGEGEGGRLLFGGRSRFSGVLFGWLDAQREERRKNKRLLGE